MSFFCALAGNVLLKNFLNLLEGDPKNNLLILLVGRTSETQALFYFENIGAEDVKLNLLKQTYKLFLILYGYFLSGWQCPASPAVNPSG